jgi:hypothetical protein
LRELALELTKRIVELVFVGLFPKLARGEA